MRYFCCSQYMYYMTTISTIKESTATVIRDLFDVEMPASDITVSLTKPEFEGDYTIVLFSLLKQVRKSAQEAGESIGRELQKRYPGFIHSYSIIKGFLNLSIADDYWTGYLQNTHHLSDPVPARATSQKVMVEYSSPNTNKPLHLGHLRNNFLGWSIAEILKCNGYEVIKSSIINDRGIHICKSMIAWQWFGNGETPEQTNQKGDHFVGDYYVRFNDEYKKEIASLMEKGLSEDEAEKEAPIMQQAQQMLRDWEAGDPEVMALWNKMNGWVYSGFEETYKTIGSDFDKTYYESQTYLLGKDIVEQGLQKGVFYQKEDGSVWIDLTADGLDEKIVRRRDGTSVYMTQDIGLVIEKYQEFGAEKSIYVVGDEQNYHFKVLKLIAQKLNLPSADGIYHLSYGMVELPSGKMKSREGTVVDADDLVKEMMRIAAEKTEELGKVKDFSNEELQALYQTIGLGALKFFLLRVDPKKRIIFNPQESIDFHGFTGPFVQYTYARIKSVLRKEGGVTPVEGELSTDLFPLEKTLIMQLEQFETELSEAANAYDPSKIAIYVFNLAKTFNSFYSEHSITNAETEEKKRLRLAISRLTAAVIKKSMRLLGIDVPERM